MILFKCGFLVLLLNISVLSVSHSIYEAGNVITRNQNNTEMKTLENIWKTNRASQKSTPSLNGNSSFNSVPAPYHNLYSSRPSHKEAINTEGFFLSKSDNHMDNFKKTRINLNNKKMFHSNRDNLLKHKSGVLNHAKSLRQILRREYNDQRSLSSNAIDRIRSDVFNDVNYNKLSLKFSHKRKPTPLKRVKTFQNVSTSKWSSQIPYSLINSDKKTQTLNGSETHMGNFTYASNCTKENNWCQSVRNHENRRWDKIVFHYEKDLKNASADISHSTIQRIPNDMSLDFEGTNKSHVVKKVLQNVSIDIPHSSINKVSNDITLDIEDTDNLPHVVKERGMLDKLFNSGNSGDKTGERFESGENKKNKKGALKVIADKLKYVFPFLAGFGRGVKKVLVKPRPKTPDHQTFKYDSNLGTFYTIPQKSKPLFYPSPIVVGSKKPILLSDLLKASSKTKLKGIPVPYNVEVEKRIPYFVKVPYDNPVPVHISQPYGVPVEKIVPYPIRVEVPEPYPVTKIVKKPYNVYVENPVPVEFDQPYPVLKEQVKPYTVETVVNKPYLHPVYNDYTVAMPYDKNIPYPVTVDNTNEHKNLLTDELENEQLLTHQENSGSNGTPHNNESSDSEINPSVQHTSFVSLQKTSDKPNCNNSSVQDNTNEQKVTPYYYSGNKSPQNIKFVKSSVPTSYAEAMKAIMKIKGNRITEVQFLDLMKKGQTRNTITQSQRLHDAFQRSLLHRQSLQALMKQNQMLNAGLARGQIKLKPPYLTKEVYPEFKPLHTNLNIPVLQNDEYYKNNNDDSKTHLNQLPESFTQKQQPLQSYNQNTYYSGILENYSASNQQNAARRPKTKVEIIDDHLRQLYNQNKNKEIEVQVSDSYSYKLPDSNTLSSYYNQGDSESGYSMQQNVYDVSPNTSLQDNDLYRLQLEYKILDNLMKNVDEHKIKTAQILPTSGYDENLVKTFNTENIQLLKFSPNESIPNVRNQYHSNKNPLYYRGKVFNGDYKERTNLLQDNNPGQTEKYNGNPSSWANLNKINHMDNYTFYLASVIKDYYHKNEGNYDHNTRQEEMIAANSDNINDVFSESTIKPSSIKPDSDSGEETVNIGNRYNLGIQHTENNSHSGSPSYFENNKFSESNESKKLFQDLFRNGLGTYKPIYNSDSKSTTNHYAVDTQASGAKVTNFPGKAVPFQVVNNENHKEVVHFGIDLIQNGTENKTDSSPYDFEIGEFVEPSDDTTTTENNMRWLSKTNAKSDETPLVGTEVENYDNYQGYYKRPLKKWTFNITDDFKKNSAINFGKLTDFLDIVNHNLPKNESESQKKETTEKLKNAIFNDVQHFDTTTDMSAESSYHIESKALFEELPRKIKNELQLTDVKNKINSIPNKYYLSVETEQPFQSTNVPDVVPNKKLRVDPVKRKGSTAHKNETVSTMETTISAYSNIRRGKDIVSNKTNNESKDNFVLDEIQNKNITNVGLNSKSDLHNRTQSKGDSRVKLIRGVTKVSLSKKNNIMEDNNGSVDKVAIITPVNISSIDNKNESQMNNSNLSEPGLQIFDLFNTIGNAISEMHEHNSNLETLEVCEKRDVNSKTFSSTALPNIPTTSPLLTTLPSSSKATANSTKSKPVRGRGSVKASPITEKSEMVHLNLKNTAVRKNYTTTESVVHDKSKRKHEKHPPSSSGKDNKVEVLSHRSVFESKLRNETNDLLSTHDKRGDAKAKEKHTVQNEPVSFDNSKDLRKFNATHKVYQKDTNEFRTVKIFPTDENAGSTTPTISIAPTPDRVTVKTVQQIERVKIKNHIKEKLENTTKKSVPKFYNYKNSSDILERRQKNRERFMFGFMITTPETSATEVSL